MKKMKDGRMGKQNVHLAFARFRVRSSVLKGARFEREPSTLQGTMKLMEMFGTFGGLGKEKD